MEPLQAIVLGILQGVFEWLPVSSEAVVTLTMTRLFGSGVMESVNAAIWVHTGTMLAATVYFRDEILGLIDISWKNRHDPRKVLRDSSETSVIRFLFLSTLVTGVVGGSIYVFGVKSLVGRPKLFSLLTGVALILTGLLRFYRSSESRMFAEVSDTDSVLIGVLQGISISPGISRSGSTTFGLFLREFNAEDALRLSFLMSIPAVLVANIGMNLFSSFSVSPELLLASGVAFVVGYGTIGTVLKFAEKSEVSIICFVLGLISFIPLLL
ncbi:MAG: undecaprenyl-diphosphate phosphatase [Candidatus Nanosalina sp.]